MKLSNSNNTRRQKTNFAANLRVAQRPISNINRFIEPLPSFPGKPPTERDLQMIQEMIDYFSENKN
jgi:hypothetical protein